MPDIQVNSLNNCAVYIDGIGYIGRASEVDVAHPKQVMTDYKGAGMVGKLELWAGVDKLESRIKWASFDTTALLAASDFTVAHMFQVRGNLQQYNSLGLAAELPVVYLMTGVFKDGGKAAFKHQEQVETESTISVYHTELWVAGIQIFLYDVYSNTYMVGGIDKLAAMKANLGLI